MTRSTKALLGLALLAIPALAATVPHRAAPTTLARAEDRHNDLQSSLFARNEDRQNDLQGVG